MDTIACHLPTSDHMVYCNDETTGVLIIGEIILKNNINDKPTGWFVMINSILE